MAYNEALFTAEQVEDFTAQRKIMRTHLGFSHVHRVVHIELNPDAGYPMLISVFCEPFALCTSLHRFRVSFGRLIALSALMLAPPKLPEPLAESVLQCGNCRG